MAGEVREILERAARARSPDADSAAIASIAAGGARLLERAGGRAVPLDAPEYPARLRDLLDPPAVVFLLGPWDHRGPLAAIVGSRAAHPYANERAEALAFDLAREGVGILSGLAEGIDAAAHRGALRAGGKSGAVLGTGLERFFPASHRPLQETLARSIGLLTEVLPGEPPRRYTFATRNRLLAALADAVLLVQGSSTSGALLTVAAAEALGRPVGALPWDAADPLAAAPHALIRERRAVLIRNAADALELLGRRGAPAPARVPGRMVPAAPEDPAAAKLLAGLRHRPEPLDVLAARAALPAAAASAALLELELAGLVRREPGGRYRKTRSG